MFDASAKLPSFCQLGPGNYIYFSFGRFTLRTPESTMFLHLNFMSITPLKRKNEVFTNYRRVTFRVLEERTTIFHLDGTVLNATQQREQGLKTDQFVVLRTASE